MAAGRRTNAKGRSVGKQGFVMLTHWAFDCPAYRALKPGPRALLFEFVRRHNGANNGRIGFSQRDMSASINVADRETVAGYVRQLEELGFVKAEKRGGFNIKVADRRATEWSLTMFPIGDVSATKDFMSWRPSKIDGTEKPVHRDGKSVPEGANVVRPRSSVSKIPSLKAANDVVSGTEIPSTYTSIAIGSSLSGERGTASAAHAPIPFKTSKACKADRMAT